MSKIKAWVTEVHKAHEPKLADGPDMVHQIWEDGEITCQKSGELLWQRGLHQLRPALSNIKADAKDMPEQYNEHGYAFVTDDNANDLREMLEDIIK